MNRTILRGFVLCLVVALLLVTQARLGFSFERSDSPCVLEQQRYDRRRVDVAGPHVHHLGGGPNSTLIPAKSATPSTFVIRSQMENTGRPMGSNGQALMNACVGSTLANESARCD